MIRAARDELSEARTELEAMRREAVESGHDRAAPIILCDLAELSCWLGDPTSAREQADAALELVRRSGRTQFAESHAFLADALVAAHVGDLAVAASAAHRAGQLANSLGHGPLADRCQVVLGQVELALGRPAEAATAFAEVEARLEAAGVGSPALYRFRGDHIESLVLAGRLDDASNCHDQLRGRRRARSDAVGSVDELTATELEVARLAATGLTNRQVAEAMVLSPKSIDGALTRIYAKLDIHSRAELGARMGSAPLDKEG